MPIPVRDDTWLSSIKWDSYCLQCQSKNNDTCPNKDCAMSTYDPWGDPFPAYVYHPDGDSIQEYIERKYTQQLIDFENF